jgi:hypothetical protein
MQKSFTCCIFTWLGLWFRILERKPLSRIRVFLVRKIIFLKPADQIDKYASKINVYIVLVLPKNVNVLSNIQF